MSIINTEQKIREDYERITANSGFKQTVGGFICFKAGYLAMLNSLENVWAETAVGCAEELYRLPDGITKDVS